jgi:spore coat polysaccharide biosynthesis protein SpsF
MGSTRLPGKVLLELGERPAIALMTERLSHSRMISAMAVATSRLPQDDPIAALCATLSLPVYRGDEEDVLDRYAGAAEMLGADVVVRLTGDCPLICPDVTDRVIRAFVEASPEVDYASNCLRRTYPRGLDTEVIARGSLDRAAREAHEAADREHVTRFIRLRPQRFRHLSVEDEEDLRWTVDTPEDLHLISVMVRTLGAAVARSDYADLLALIARHPEWTRINAHVTQKAL